VRELTKNGQKTRVSSPGLILLLNYSQNKKLRKVLGVIKSMYRSAKGSEGIDWPTCFFETFCQYLGGSFKGGKNTLRFVELNLEPTTIDAISKSIIVIGVRILRRIIRVMVFGII